MNCDCGRENCPHGIGLCYGPAAPAPDAARGMTLDQFSVLLSEDPTPDWHRIADERSAALVEAQARIAALEAALAQAEAEREALRVEVGEVLLAWGTLSDYHYDRLHAAYYNTPTPAPPVTLTTADLCRNPEAPP